VVVEICRPGDFKVVGNDWKNRSRRSPAPGLTGDLGRGFSVARLKARLSDAEECTCYVRSSFVKLISAFSTRETGHPAFAFSVISSNFAASIPGTFPFRSR
jgi:hypothetical protein